MGFKLADLFVSITGNDKPLNQTLANVKNGLMGMAGVGARAGAGIGAGLMAGLGLAAGIGAAAALGMGLAKAVMAASDLNETINKTNVIFGDQDKIITAAANQMAADFGIVKTTFMDTSSEIGNLLQGMGGQSRQASAEMSVELTKAAADASSIFNVSFEEAAGAIESALRGQSEPLSAFGVDVQESAVKLNGLAHGARLVNGELTTQDKVAARARVVIAGLQVAHGDLKNTMGGFANSFRSAWGRATNAAASFGQAIMPIVERFLDRINRMEEAVGDWVEQSKPYIETFVASYLKFVDYVEWGAGQVGEAIGQLGAELIAEITSWDAYKAVVHALGVAWEWLKGTAESVFETIGVVFRNWHSIVGMATIRARQYIINAGEAMTWLGTTAAALLEWFGANWVRLFTDYCSLVATVFQNFAVNIGENMEALWEGLMTGEFHFNWTPLLQGFKATIDKLPEIARPAFTNLQGEIDDLLGKVGDVETKRQEARNKSALDAAKGQAPRPERAKANMTPIRKGEITDLAGFAKKLQEGALGKGQAALQTAKNTGKIVDEVKILGDKIVAQGKAAPTPAIAVGPK